MAPWTTYLQVFFCVALLFFMIPIKIDGPDEVELQFLDYLEKFHKTYDGDTYQSKLQAFKVNKMFCLVVVVRVFLLEIFGQHKRIKLKQNR
jgi:hypothetical protein